MNMKMAKGEGKIGCLFFLILAIILVFGLIKITPVYLAKVNFSDDIDNITSRAGVYGWTERMIRKEINTAAVSYGFQVAEDDILVTRTNKYQQTPRVMVTVRFSKGVEFPGFAYVFKFEHNATGLIGSL